MSDLSSGAPRSSSTPPDPSLPSRPEGLELPALLPGESEAFAALLGLIRRLRGPDGCPWDREQSLRTMTPYILEEAYEVIDSIERNDSAALREELGDLIFLLFFCAEVGREETRFTIDELLERHLLKMIGRHPHVFGPAGRLEPGQAAQQWEEIKQEEGDEWRSVVDGRLKSLPALTSAYRIQEKAAAVGFDWENVSGVLDKIEEEIAELRAELKEARPGAPGDPEREELGDLLFALVNLARTLRIDPEGALRGSTARFVQRFRYVEEELAKAGTRPSRVGLAELDRLWEEAKARESGRKGKSPID